MAKIKIFELAKDMDVPSKEVVSFLQSKNIEVASHMSSIEESEAEMVKRHFGKAPSEPVKKEVARPTAPDAQRSQIKKPMAPAQGQNVRRPQDGQPPRKMFDSPQDKMRAQQQAQPQRRMLDGPQDRMRNQQQAQPQRRMLDGPQDRMRTQQQGQPQRRMLDGPQNRDRRPLNDAHQNGAKRPDRNFPRNNGTRTINGVVISSDDGDNRLIHGSFRNEADFEAIKREKAKEAQARREAERAEEAKRAAENEKKADELAAKARAEAAEIQQNIDQQKAAKEAALEAEKKAAEEAALAEKNTAEKTAVKEDTEAPAPAPVPEKIFKNPNTTVRPNVIRRADPNAPVSRPAYGDRRNDRSGRPSGDGRNDNRGERTERGDRQGFNRPQGDRNNRPNSPDRNHYQAVESRYDGNNKGHSNLFENQNQKSRSGAPGGFQRDNNRPNNGRPNGFSQRPQGNSGFGKEEEESKPVSHSRDPKKRTSAPELAESMKQQNNRRNDKSKDKEKANKRFGDYDDMQNGKKGKNQKDPNRAGAFHRPEPVKQEVVEETIKVIKLPDVLTIQELADKMKIKGGDIVKKLFLAGKICSLNSDVTFEEAENIALEYEIIAEHEEKVDRVAELLKEADEIQEKLVKRPPVVCVMGHVDHGKTSLLDAIRATSVTSREAGGITQHIGAYMVECNGEKITFLDTPGHEAFTAMRLRGAKSTDIAVLVVAADDGVMPQTVEAINHAKAAGVEIIVAVNKIDKPTANIERVKQELTEYELVTEDWGGSTVFVPVSAKTGEGIDKLLEMILLTADVLELKANPERKARGLVIEAQLDKGRGPVATVLVQKGTLKVGDNIVIGSSMGKVRALINDKGEKVKQATPSMPVEILGLNSVPNSGEVFVATNSDKEAKEIAEAYIEQNKEKLIAETKAKVSLDGLFSQIEAGNIKELNIVVKADVQGSVEAIKQSLLKLSTDEVAVRIIHSGVGAINESDATLASASKAIIIGFNTKPDNTAKDICEREKVDLRLYNVIYNAIDDVEAALKGMLAPIYEEQIIAHAEVRQTFKASGVGMIAGSYVLDGKITRGCKARINRGKDQIFDGNLASLKRFKDDVKEVNAGYECGLVFEKFSDLMEGDLIELYQMVEVPRK